jgi:signal transduction histidine kinase
MQSERTKADLLRNRKRIDLDARRALERKSKESSAANERSNGDESLASERRLADENLQAERKRGDDAIELERTEKQNAGQELFTNERKATDKDLALERSNTDHGLKNAEQSLLSEQKAHSDTKTALTTREEYLAIVSHDLRNPIGAISTCAGMLLDDILQSKLSSETRTWIEFIQRNADSALRLTSDLLDMERISAGKLEMQFGEYNISELLKETTENYASLAAPKSILLRTINSQAEVYVMCDRDRIMQVLSNLVGNAIKFTPEQGYITLQVQEREHDIVEISISDTGLGIPAEKKATIFERFSQIRKKDRRWLGLGLYISKQIIDAHQGHLWVDSVEDKGSTFYFTLQGAK